MHGCIPTFNMYTLFYQYMRQSLSSFNFLGNFITSKHCHLLSSILWMQLSYQIYEIKWSLIFYSDLHFYLIKMNYNLMMNYLRGQKWWKKWCCQLEKKLHIGNKIRDLAVSNEHWHGNNCWKTVIYENIKSWIWI